MAGKSDKVTLAYYQVINEETKEEVVVAANTKKEAALLAQEVISDRKWERAKVILKEAKQARMLEGLNPYDEEEREANRG